MPDPYKKDDQWICPSCKGILVNTPNCFYTNLVGEMSGLICKPCNALWDNPDNSFLKAQARAVEHIKNGR